MRPPEKTALNGQTDYCSLATLHDDDDDGTFVGFQTDTPQKWTKKLWIGKAQCFKITKKYLMNFRAKNNIYFYVQMASINLLLILGTKFQIYFGNQRSELRSQY